jgi:hypothetical protein
MTKNLRSELIQCAALAALAVLGAACVWAFLHGLEKQQRINEQSVSDYCRVFREVCDIPARRP